MAQIFNVIARSLQLLCHNETWTPTDVEIWLELAKDIIGKTEDHSLCFVVQPFLHLKHW